MKNSIKIWAVVVGVFLLSSCQKEFTITAVPKDASMGTVTGGGVYKQGTSIKLEALPNSGYQFEKWTDGIIKNPRTITVEKNATYTAVFVKEDNGGDDGGGDEPSNTMGISISSTLKVLFSPGNLQWSATNGGSTATTHTVAGNGTSEGTWRFAPNQWDIIGAENMNISSTYTGWIDLFGWCTSGCSKGGANYIFPYVSSVNVSDYGPGYENIAGTNYDWGLYNAIYNPQTDNTDDPGTWRTLTKDEWKYLLETRRTTSGIRYAKANVHGVNGLIIVPDNWVTSIYSLNNTNTSGSYTSNTINDTSWTNMEQAGCVFLPAAGCRYGKTIQYAGTMGSYRSVTHRDNSSSYYLLFDESYFYPMSESGAHYMGYSVRLVKNAE